MPIDDKYVLVKGGNSVHDENPEYIELINLAFGFTGTDHPFTKILPKLFGPGVDSASRTWFVKERESGKFVAAVGCFPITFNVCGEEIKAFGIGNVAVHPEYRGEGFMKACMEAAYDEMTASGAAMSLLSGRRHRYNHFGYEKCAAESVFTLTRKCVSYLRPDLKSALEMKKLERTDEEALDRIYDLHNTRAYRALRDRSMLYDIMISWEAEPYVFLKDGGFAGWAILKGNTVTEMIAEDDLYLDDMIVALTGIRQELEFLVPPFDTSLESALWKYTETVYTGADLCFSVFDYEKVLGLLMKLKCGYEKMADGGIVVRVNGVNGRENLRISVKNNLPSVEKCDDEPDITLDHLAAMRFFFMERSPERSLLPPALASWFPLPIYVHSADNV